MENGANLGSGIAAYYTPFLRIEKGAAREKDLRDLQRDLEFIKSRQTNCHCENLAYETTIDSSCHSPLDGESGRFYNVIPQVICRDAFEFRTLVDAIQKLKRDCGFAPDEVFPQIDINMGCPFPMQAKAGRGSGLLPRIEAVREILQEVANRAPLKFSVKMRLGYTTPDESLTLLPLLNDAPLTHVTMHPRLGIQQYKGALDFDAFERFYTQCRHPLIFNGDVTSINDIQAIARRFPNLKGIMIGRGLLANPALASQYQSKNFNIDRNPLPPLLKIHKAVLDNYRSRLQGDAQILEKIRPFWTYAETILPKRTVKKISKSRDLNEYLHIVAEMQG